MRIGAPFLAAPLADMLSLSLSTSVVPRQWKTASILPVAKVPNPTDPQITDRYKLPLLCIESSNLLLLRTIYPSLRHPTLLPYPVRIPSHSFYNCCTHPPHPFHHYPASYQPLCRSLDFSKAFDSVRHSAVLGKYAYGLYPRSHTRTV